MLDSPRPDRTMYTALSGFRSDLISRTFQRWVTPSLPLALLAFAAPAFAAGHHTAMPVHRAAAPQMSRATHVTTARSAHEARALRQPSPARATAQTRKQTALSSTRAGRGAHGMVYAAALHGRHAEEAAAERTGTKRLGKSVKGHTNDTAAVQPERSHSVHGKHASTQKSYEQDEAEVAADLPTSARIHAWYNRQTTAAALQAGETSRNTHRPVLTAANAVPVTSATGDLSAATRRPTAADVSRAAAQHETIQAAAEQNQRQTTAADDNADAESHIPSTAPTERVPSPFIHGETLGTVPANHSRNDDAPVVRQPGAFAAQTAPASSRSNVPVLAVMPQRIDLRGKNASSTDITSLNKSAPAIAAVQSGARRPKLDAPVAEGMAEENFDDDGAPATARTAVGLAIAGPSASTKKAAAQDGATPLASLASVNVNLYDSSGHLLVMAPMKGSHEILVHQNQMALEDGLDRIQNDYQLAEMRRKNLLVSLPDDDSIYPNDVLPMNRRYARPWTVRFLRDLARAHYARFGTPLIVTSAARTVEFQRHLVRVNGNAAPPTGDIASPHLYGQAVDLGKRGMGLTELTWMRAYLTPVEADGRIDVEEEFQQACFHISVYRRYLGAPAKPAQKLQAPALMEAKAAPVQPPAPEARKRRLPTALLATGLR